MGKQRLLLQARRKALASRKYYKQEPLSISEQIADCHAKIRSCEQDLKYFGRNDVISDKIKYLTAEINILRIKQQEVISK